MQLSPTIIEPINSRGFDIIHLVTFEFYPTDPHEVTHHITTKESTTLQPMDNGRGGRGLVPCFITESQILPPHALTPVP